MAKALAPVIPQDDAFRDSFCIATATGKFARYLLRAIEDFVARSPHPEWITQPDAEKVNLEHVLPKRPSKGWSVTPEEIDALKDRIGNLAILPKAQNAKLENKPLADKCKEYGKCSYAYTQWIAHKTDWGVDEIEERQALLADQAVKVWPSTV